MGGTDAQPKTCSKSSALINLTCEDNFLKLVYSLLFMLNIIRVGSVFFLLIFLAGCTTSDPKLCTYEQNDFVSVRGVIVDTHVITDDRSTPAPEYTIVTIRTQDCDIRALKKSITYDSKLQSSQDKVTKNCIEQDSGAVVFDGLYRPQQVNKERFDYQVTPTLCTKTTEKI